MLTGLIENDIISEELREFTVDNFLTYDIEVIQKDVDGEKLLSPISIGIGSTFTSEMYFERKTSSPLDGDLLVSEFMDYLENIYSEYTSTLPDEIVEAYKDLKAENQEDEIFQLKQKRYAHLRKLEKILTLSCYGYNSSMYQTSIHHLYQAYHL